MQQSSISDGLGLTVNLLDYGARICEIDFMGSQLALGYQRIEDYVQDSYYMGATVGPIANRVSRGQITVEGEQLRMPHNEGANTLHSAGKGFDKQTWRIDSHETNQICYALNYDMSEIGLKGQLSVMTVYKVVQGCLTIKYLSRTDTTCYINLTNHVYLNLDGRDSAPSDDISSHCFSLHADSFNVVDKQNLPTGEIKPLSQPFLYKLKNSPEHEFKHQCDHHFNVGEAGANTLRPMLTAFSGHSGIQLEVSGNSPGFQFYTGKYLNAPFKSAQGFCVETQLAPDAINQPGFYSPLLRVNEEREQLTYFQFSKT